MNSIRFSVKLCLISTFLLTGLFGALNQRQAEGKSEATPQIPNHPATNYTLNLPLIGKSFPAPPTVYGVETVNFMEWKIDKASQANIFWLHHATFNWAAIEPTRPSPNHTYNWDTVNNDGLIRAYDSGLTVIAVIRNTPGWARMPQYSAYPCGPITATALDNYAQFVYDLVLRYSQPPYNIHYYELGNEPDVAPVDLGTNYNATYGCWGNWQDIYFGGGYYAEMLKHAYPAVKKASPQSQVLIGGLLLFCDPTQPPGGQTCLSSKFLEGILHNQGGAFFDILAFHSYARYEQDQILDENYPNFAVRGGQIVGKVDFLHSVMRQYGVNKPLMMIETGIRCLSTTECNPPSDTFLQLQADSVVSAYIRSWGLNLLGTCWYTLEDSGWDQTGLHTLGTSRPAYYALVFMTNELKNATIGPQITQFPKLRGY